MRVLSVGVIGYGVVGKRRIQHILDNKNLKLKYVSDIEFKKNFTKKKVDYFINYLDLIKKKTKHSFCYFAQLFSSKSYKIVFKK